MHKNTGSIKPRSGGTLYVVATPIGNLKDITLRALEILKTADLILAEDTRVTEKLLRHFEIKKPVWRFDEYAGDKNYGEVSKRLEGGASVAFVTDAGTPAVADPGWKLVSFLRKNHPTVSIVPIPGASSVTAVLSVAGVNADSFVFLGYPPQKKGRKSFFENLKSAEPRPIVLFESPHRFQKALDGLEATFGSEAIICVGREATKLYEDIFCGEIKNARTHFTGERAKGEFVIIIP